MDAATRELVRRRAAGKCEYCRLPDEADEWPFHVEHIVPRQHGGGNGLENLCWACSRCNLHKGSNLVGIDTESVRSFRYSIRGWENGLIIFRSPMRESLD